MDLEKSVSLFSGCCISSTVTIVFVSNAFVANSVLGRTNLTGIVWTSFWHEWNPCLYPCIDQMSLGIVLIPVKLYSRSRSGCESTALGTFPTALTSNNELDLQFNKISKRGDWKNFIICRTIYQLMHKIILDSIQVMFRSILSCKRHNRQGI